MDDGDRLIPVRAVKKGWYGLEPQFLKLYEPDKMDEAELTFMCRERDFSDHKKPIIPKEYIGKNFPFKSRTGWMMRLEDAPKPEVKAAESEPLVLADGGDNVPVKRGPGRPPKVRAADQA